MDNVQFTTSTSKSIAPILDSFRIVNYSPASEGQLHTDEDENTAAKSLIDEVIEETENESES